MNEWRVVKEKRWERFRWMVSGKSKKDELSRVVKAKVDVSYSRKACELAHATCLTSGIEKRFIGNGNNS